MQWYANLPLMEISMNKKSAAAAIVALSLAASGLAFGQDRRDNRDYRDNRDNRDNRNYRDNGNQNDRGRDGQARDERGAGPNHDWRRGDRLPAEYRHRNYVVDDWRGHQLSAPPRGYHWVQAGGDYVLAAIATGIILNLAFGR